MIMAQEGISVKFHQLDIGEKSSLQTFSHFIKTQYGKIDLLVNNAAIAFKRNSTESIGHQAELTIKTNFFALKNVCDILFPLLSDGARVVNISSSCGHLSKLLGGGGNTAKAAELATKFASSDTSLTIQELTNLMNDYVAHAKAGTHTENGWPNSTYVMSKIGVSALSRIQQRNFDEMPNADRVVNHCLLYTSPSPRD